MSLNEEVDLLRRVPLFSNVEPSKLKLLAFTSERLNFQEGQVLFRQNEAGDAAYVIIDGEAQVLVETEGREVEVARVGKNAFIGEIAILCDKPRSATVKALTRVTTLKITKDLFFRLVTEFPEMAVEIMRELAQRLEATTDDLAAARRRLSNEEPEVRT